MGDYEKIRVDKGLIVTITLNDPDRRNALSAQMIGELLDAIEAAKTSDARVVILGAEGRSFSAGASFADSSGGKGFEEFPKLLSAIFDSEVPIIAAIGGHALGGGLGIAAASSFAIASDNAEFATPEINLGLFPMMIMAALVRVVPRRKLLDMMLLGERFGAAQALDYGIVSRVVARESLDSEVRALAEKLAEKSPAAIRRGLRALAFQDGVRLDAALPSLKDALLDCLSTADAREGIVAFMEKRKPVFTGK